MSFKWVIDSLGNAVSIPQDKNSIRILKQEIRINELKKFAEGLLNALKETSSKINTAYFDFMVQPLYNKERVIYFTKSNISTTAKVLKLSRELVQNPQIENERPEFQDKDVVNFCKSIFKDEKQEKKWFYLSVGCILFERNFYDCKYIDVTHIQPIPYAQFIKDLSTKNNNPNEKYEYISSGTPIDNVQELSQKAFVNELTSEETSPFILEISAFVNEYIQKNEIDKRDKASNKTTLFISLINNFKGDIFSTYLEIKNVIKKLYNEAYNISYVKNSNLITAQIDDNHKIEIFVCNGNNGAFNYIVNGNIFTSINNLKAALQNLDNLLKPNDWFTKKVLPCVETHDKKTKTVEKG